MRTEEEIIAKRDLFLARAAKCGKIQKEMADKNMTREMLFAYNNKRACERWARILNWVLDEKN